MPELLELSLKDKFYLEAFMALLGKVFSLHLEPGLAMLSVSQSHGRSSYRAVVRGLKKPTLVVCNFRTRQPRRSLSPKECRWAIMAQISSIYGSGVIDAVSYFSAVFSNANYAGRNHGKITARGDKEFLKVIASINSVMDQFSLWSSPAEFAETMCGTVLEDVKQDGVINF